MGFLWYRRLRASFLGTLVTLFSLSFYVDDIGGTKASDFLVEHFGTQTTLWIFRGLSLVMIAVVGALYLWDVRSQEQVEREAQLRKFAKQREKRPFN